MVFFVECAIALYRENQKNTYLFLIFTEPRPEGLLRNPARWESLQIAHFPGKSKIILTIFKFFKRSWKTYNSQRFFWFFFIFWQNPLQKYKFSKLKSPCQTIQWNYWANHSNPKDQCKIEWANSKSFCFSNDFQKCSLQLKMVEHDNLQHQTLKLKR